MAREPTTFPQSRPNQFPRPFPDVYPPALTTIEDWEGKTDLSGWGGDTGALANQSDSTLEGSRNVTPTSTNTNKSASRSTNETEQGNEYRMRFQLPNVANPNSVRLGIHMPTNDGSLDPETGYYAVADVDDSLNIVREDGGGSATLLTSSSPTVDANTHLQVGLKNDTSNNLQAFLYDSTGAQLASTSVVTDSTHTSGAVWFLIGPSGGMVDDFREVPL